ncbi:ABC transporter ATP-binding protein [Nocardia panacis]|uniref:ABC transporter ATP-binding protein n=1 Tax=Nocardia panacis TaxID=2340916 RepID=UPI001EEFAABD|nr:ATP-binding cassette domain-containing protein [Nocardia panacis]
MSEIAVQTDRVATHTEDSVLVDGFTVCGTHGRELFGPTTFRMTAGTVTALAGPSGSGKTTLMRALLGYLPPGATRTAGAVAVLGRDIFGMKPAELRTFRRDHLAYVGQDPASALNPLMRVHRLLTEVAPKASRQTCVETLESVGLSADHLRRRPAELSGGQQRRVALARALIRSTPILVLDEPLAGLHGALRTEIAGLLAELAETRGTAILLSGHDTAAAHAIAHTIVDIGTTTVPAAERAADAANAAREAREQRAAAADRMVGLGGAMSEPAGAVGDQNGHRADSLLVRATADIQANPDCARVLLVAKEIGATIGAREILTGVTFELAAGGAVAVVGASGAGKTTLARVLAGLHPTATGSLIVHDVPVPLGKRRRHYGGNGIQLVTQNPRSALNPRRTVAQTLSRPLRRIGGVPRRQVAQRIAELLTSVELAPELAGRYPAELSGGQRQRVALARALAAEPAVLICDEITSALDHPTAAAIMGLLHRIRRERGTGLVVISHDMALVARHCGQVLVLEGGRVVESGDTTAVLVSAEHDATRALLG